MLRVATYNIRNVRALDRASLWWRRRGQLAEVLREVDADIWGMQEAYRSQIHWLGYYALKDDWDDVGEGRGRRGGGEAVPVWVQRDQLEIVEDTTLWYGDTPDRPGSRLAGAGFPRIATLVEIEHLESGAMFVIANTHLDEKSGDLRRQSLTQLAEWLSNDHASMPIIVMGDLNCTLDEAPVAPLLELGLRPVLSAEDGPTANNFGRDDEARQIDHIFVSPHWHVTALAIHLDAGHASDHYPVVADLELDPGDQ